MYQNPIFSLWSNLTESSSQKLLSSVPLNGFDFKVAPPYLSKMYQVELPKIKKMVAFEVLTQVH